LIASDSMKSRVSKAKKKRGGLSPKQLQGKELSSVKQGGFGGRCDMRGTEHHINLDLKSKKKTKFRGSLVTGQKISSAPKMKSWRGHESGGKGLNVGQPGFDEKRREGQSKGGEDLHQKKYGCSNRPC